MIPLMVSSSSLSALSAGLAPARHAPGIHPVRGPGPAQNGPASAATGPAPPLPPTPTGRFGPGPASPSRPLPRGSLVDMSV